MANINFRTMTCRNIGTVGDMPLTIELDRNVTTVVYGDNGVGKSGTLLDTIMFCLYNKPFKKIKLGDLVNNVNKKNMVVELTLDKGSHSYKIVRGYKPSLFEIYVDGTKLPATNTQQSLIENDIIGVPYNTFKQIVCMGKANYQSFMDLAKDKRREFVETILDISIFRDMLVKHKEEVKATNSSLSFKKQEYKHKVALLEKTKEYITNLQNAISNSNKELIDEYQSIADKAQRELDGITKPDTKAISTEYEAVKKKYNDASKLLTGLKSKQVSANKVIAFLNDNDTCPTCKQIIHDDFMEKVISENQTELDKTQEMINKLSEKMADMDIVLSDLDQKLNEAKAVEFNITRLETEISRNKTKINELVNQEKKDDTEAVKKAKAEMKETLNEAKALKKEIEELEELAETQSIVSMMLSDKGIKSIIINKYLPTINSLINRNLANIGLFATIKFDEEFNDEIKKRGFDDFSYNQLSEGEKLRVDLSIMMAWREIAALKSNLSINLLVMDEIFNTSMDYKGCKAFIDMLNSMTENSTFIISPNAEDIIDLCRSSIKLVKTDGFVSISK